MVKQRIEPRLDEARDSGKRAERFAVEPRERRGGRHEAHPLDSEISRGSWILRRLAWMVIFLGLVFLSYEGVKWYADHSESSDLSERIEQFEADFSAARRRLLDLPVRHIAGSSESARGRELRHHCEDLGRAFVANPQPEVRDLMLQYCQAYEQYQETGEAPRDLPDPAARP